LPIDNHIDYIEFPSTSSQKSRDFFAAAFGWTFANFSPSYDEIHGAGVLAAIESGDAVKTAGPLAVIRTSDLEKARSAVIAAGGEITLPLFEFPGGARFQFREPGGTEMGVWVTY
jgi:predicted enzyme related to lactoylglutathione lyase